MVRFAALDKTKWVVVIPKHLDHVFPLLWLLCISWWNFLGSFKECIYHWSFVLQWVVGTEVKVLVCVHWFPVHTYLNVALYSVLWKLLCPRMRACCLPRFLLWTECSGRWNWGVRGTLAHGLSWDKRGCPFTTILDDEIARGSSLPWGMAYRYIDIPSIYKSLVWHWKFRACNEHAFFQCHACCCETLTHALCNRSKPLAFSKPRIRPKIVSQKVFQKNLKKLLFNTF